jgi:hypothetical protein
MEPMIDAAFGAMFLLCFGLCMLGMLRGILRGLLAGDRRGGLGVPCAGLGAEEERRIERLKAERNRLDALTVEAQREGAEPSPAPRRRGGEEGRA